LHHYGDLERLANRVIQGIARPRDLNSLKNALEQAADVRAHLQDLLAKARDAKSIYPLDGKAWPHCEKAIRLVEQAIVEEPPATLAKGGVSRQGYSAELDAIEASVADAKRWVAELERVERERIGIRNLKVGYNKVFGYYLEISKSNLDSVPPEYIRKQTLVNAERYITPELKEHEALILSAAERTQELEVKLYEQVLQDLAAMANDFVQTAQAIAHLDVYLALAEVAVTNNYVRPELDDDHRVVIHKGRHPVVEQTLADEPFVPNDTLFSPDEAIHIITGPNMSGKSTYLRQVALIALMAQMGSFVPAESAHIGLIDRIFAVRAPLW